MAIKQCSNRLQGQQLALWPIALKYLVRLMVPPQPSQAVVEKALAVVEVGLAALAIGNPVHPLRAE
ncbi:hypothetical protein D3C76_1838030 [compost metagenome]